MNINNIKEIVSSPLLDDTQKESLILQELSKDENVILNILTIIGHERDLKNYLLLEINNLLSKAEIALSDSGKKLNKDGFVQNEILKFYEDHSDQIRHCYRSNKS